MLLALGWVFCPFDLRFFVVIFLFDDCVCRPLFLVGGLPCAGGPCRGWCGAVAVTLLFECPHLDQLVHLTAGFVSDIAAF